MRNSVLRAVSAILVLCIAFALATASATAQPGTGPREKINQGFTTKRPGAPTGIGFTGSFHAAGDRHGNPPNMRRMVFHPPHGMRYDTNVPGKCTASDLQLQTRGPDACPVDSWLGGGTVEGLIMEPVGHDFVFDHYHHHIDLFNNTNEQIILVHSEGWTVARGEMRPDGSIAFQLPTCFPVPPVTGCVDDYIIQLATSSAIEPYKKRIDGHVRSYATTPRRCPARGFWRTRVRFDWANGATDRVVTKQPCRHRHRHCA
jgi:hypothetical protein